MYAERDKDRNTGETKRAGSIPVSDCLSACFAATTIAESGIYATENKFADFSISIVTVMSSFSC